MRLTNYIRDSFIRSVSNNIPEPKHPSKDALQAMIVKAMAPKVRAVYNDESLRNCLAKEGVHIPEYGYCRVVIGDVKLDELLSSYREAVRVREAAIKEVRSVAYGCTTLKQLQEALPDLIKHMPSEKAGVIANAPVPTGLMDRLKAAGFKE